LFFYAVFFFPFFFFGVCSSVNDTLLLIYPIRTVFDKMGMGNFFSLTYLI
jgi:hypothetical protein